MSKYFFLIKYLLRHGMGRNCAYSLLVSVFTLFMGCRYAASVPMISLELFPLEEKWPPAILTRSYDGAGIVLSPDLEYAVGHAVLLVRNLSNSSIALRFWTDESWTVVVRQDESVRRVRLLPTTRSLPSFPPPPIFLESEESRVFVVGLSDYKPFSRQKVALSVEYSDQSTVYSSNEVFLTGDSKFTD